MRKIVTQVFRKASYRLGRKRVLGEDTRRLPSLVKAMRYLVPRSVLKEVLASSHDRRQWGVLAAAWVGVSEREFICAAARELGIAYQDSVAVPDLTIFGAKARPIMLALRRVGAIVVLQNENIVGFVATDPAEVRGLDFYNGMQVISMAPWTEIARALDMAERLIAECEANTDRSESVRRKDLCDRILNILIQEAMNLGALTLEILSSEGKNRYQFVARDGKVAIGSIDAQALESLLLYLSGIDGGAFTHHSAGKVLVRNLGSSANVRLSWHVGDAPSTIAWSVPERPLDLNVDKVNPPARISPDIAIDSTCNEGLPIMVVDDNPMFCRILERLLKREKFAVSFAGNGKEALEILSGLVSLLPRVIICDLHMPHLNGVEFVKLIKSDPRLKEIPIVMLTSDDGVEVEVSVLEIGVDALISKGKDPRVLCAQVVRLAKTSQVCEAA